MLGVRQGDLHQGVWVAVSEILTLEGGLLGIGIPSLSHQVIWNTILMCCRSRQNNACEIREG